MSAELIPVSPFTVFCQIDSSGNMLNFQVNFWVQPFLPNSFEILSELYSSVVAPCIGDYLLKQRAPDGYSIKRYIKFNVGFFMK